MYNRYIPQPDGTYRRNRISDNPGFYPPQPPRQEPRHQEVESAPVFAPEPEVHTPESRKRAEQHPKQDFCPHNRPRSQRPAANTVQKQTYYPAKQDTSGDKKDGSIGNFLRQLLPKDFDTGDLLIVLLLLLMSGDCKEDQNSSLLTLALYLFM